MLILVSYCKFKFNDLGLVLLKKGILVSESDHPELAYTVYILGCIPMV